jgi:hypothetical protein
MKILQTTLLKIVIPSLFIFSFLPLFLQAQKTTAADSLFRAKRFTESIEFYQRIFTDRKYSQAMLLKMAYIQEGLGKIGLTLYYLKLYYLASNDEQALHKMEELAAKFKLSGYETNETDRLHRWLDKNLFFLQGALALLLFIAAFILFIQRRNDQKPWTLTFVIVLLVSCMLYFTDFYSDKAVIVSQDRTYLMDAPSAGSAIAGIVDEGNQMVLIGLEDVWLKVKWMDKVVYVKKNSVLPVTL